MYGSLNLLEIAARTKWHKNQLAVNGDILQHTNAVVKLCANVQYICQGNLGGGNVRWRHACHRCHACLRLHSLCQRNVIWMYVVSPRSIYSWCSYINITLWQHVYEWIQQWYRHHINSKWKYFVIYEQVFWMLCLYDIRANFKFIYLLILWRQLIVHRKRLIIRIVTNNRKKDTGNIMSASTCVVVCVSIKLLIV